MCVFVVLGLVFPYQPRDLLGKHLRNDLFCVEWDVKPQLSQSLEAICDIQCLDADAVV